MTGRHDPTGWMWAQAVAMIDEAERLHRRFFHLASSGQAQPAWQPPLDVFEDEREIVVVVAMPGVVAGGVQVTQEPGALVVRGVRPLPLSGTRYAVRQLEIPYGAFERRIPLPAGRFEISAPSLDQGCLILHLTKVRTLR